MAFSVGGAKGRPSGEINVTPLIDIVLVLLIIFMVMTPVMLKELVAKVPQKSTELVTQPPGENPIIVGLDAKGAPNSADYVGIIPILVKAVQDQQAWCTGGDETIHVHPLAPKENVAQAFHSHEGVFNLVRREQEGMFANVELHARMKRQEYQFAGGIARERNAARTGSDADQEWHPGEGALHAAGERHQSHRQVRVLPQHDVMFEEDGVSGAEVDLGGGNDLALHLASARAEVDLRHVLDPGRLAPARFADQIANIERSSAGAAGQSSLLIHALAPLALNPFQ